MARGNTLAQGKGGGAALAAYRERKKEEALQLAKQREIQELADEGLILLSDLKEDEEARLAELEKETQVEPVKEIKKKRKMELNIDPSKIYNFELIEKSEASRNVIVGTTNKIFDTEDNRIREIKYLPIADTIYVEDMDASLAEQTSPYLGFHNNYLSVSGKDVRLIEYLMAHDDNEANPKRLNKRSPAFRLIDKELIEKTKTASHDFIDRVRETIKAKDADELRPVAQIMFNIVEKDDTALRNKLRDLTVDADINVAARKAKQVLDNIDNPKFDRQFLIMKGFEKGIIRLETEQNTVVWANTGVVVSTVRNIRDQNKTAGELAEWSFLEEGEKFWNVFSKKV